MRSILFRCALACGLAGAVIGACSATRDDSDTSNGGGGANLLTTSTANGGNGGSGGEGGILPSGVGGAGGACIGEEFLAEAIPLDIFIMLDQSNSMNEEASAGQTRWEMIEEAISDFVMQPGLDGLGLGINFFGQPESLVDGCYLIPCTSDMDCTGGCGACLIASGVCSSPYNPDVDSCESADYAWAEVPIQPMPGVGPLITSAIGVHMPSTNTPTYPALEGAIQYAKAWQIAHPDHITVVAFATDGGPGTCDTDLMHINAVAAAGFSGAPSIQTFVIGVGPLLMALDGIAAAGGTTTAYHVDLDAMAADHFLDALNDIRGRLPCIYLIPDPPSGMEVDFERVNVTYQPSDGSAEVTIPKVEDESSCPSSGFGWYYDDNDNPTNIILCDATCELVGDDLQAEVDIVLGCMTVVE
jgi:hypothetical protein